MTSDDRSYKPVDLLDAFDFLFDANAPEEPAPGAYKTDDAGADTSYEHKARRLLKHTWHAFFGRFGRLTDAQRLAIEPVVSGESLILSAATASGKTEALLAPLIERRIQESHPQAKTSDTLRIIVVCPTRALCNDFLRRVRHPILTCQWSVDLKSGDNPSFDPQKPPNILITTPESLDSLLSRVPWGLKSVDALFIDEVHLLDGSARGDHMRVLVSRLKSFRPDLQICCASATAPQTERIARAFIQPRRGETPRILKTAGGRDRHIKIHYQRFVSLSDAALSILKLCQDTPGTKLLVFANRRAEVEWLAADLATHEQFPVFAHHGSLAKPERLRVEKAFLEASHGVCVATMTLELGVDIGDVDRVVLLNPPANVSSFTQRIGRSNRRGGDLQVTCLFSTPFDRERFEHLAQCAEKGRLFADLIAFRPAILPQQILSLLFQNPKNWVSARALHARLPADVAREWSPEDCRAILEIMRERALLHADSRGRYVPDEQAIALYQIGQMHTHIEPDPEVEVIDETTGRSIGRAEWSRVEHTRLENVHEGLLLGGRQRTVTRVKDNKVFVESHGKTDEPSFASRIGPNYSFGLAQDLAQFIGHTPGEMRLRSLGIRGDNQKWLLEHYFGSIWGKLLEIILRKHRFSFDPRGIGPFRAPVIYRARTSRDRPPKNFGSAAQIETAILEGLNNYQRKLEKKLQAGPWRTYIPQEMTRRWLIQSTRTDEFAHTLAAFRLVTVE